MITLLKVLLESIRFAFQQLISNKLRSFLSLIGISIGVFCIIGVTTSVDSLESNVRGSLEKLGRDVIYVKKWPWADLSDSWWHYFRRPQPSHEEYAVLTKKMNTTQLTAYHTVIGMRTLKHRSSSVDGTVLIACSHSFEQMFKLEFDKGRYFSPRESQMGSSKIILGYRVAEQLFGNIEPIGREVKLSGRKYEVVGIIKKAGNDLLNPLDFDDCLLLPYNAARVLANLKSTRVFDTSITLKAKDGIPLEELKDEATGILRAQRRLKPREDDSFSLNELSMIASFFDSFFGVLNLIGFFIGFFAILVGGFSVANIMFVSVKERTSIIGVKKALGAKRYILLLEFLIESIILCLIGGAMGLLFVYLVTTILTNVIGFELFLSTTNMIVGVSLSVGIGIVAGFIPALQAARMDPVVAMRQ